jgi:protein-L-isoaspartate(D-aspartate) O-methyltransferase
MTRDEDPYTSEEHEAMVQLIEARGVRDPAVLRAMRQVPRQRFVPHSLVSMAFDDGALPIGEGQTISQPYIVAYMSEAAALRAGDRVLEVGCGCGYQAAVLSAMGAEVYGLEIIRPLAEAAADRLSALGYTRATVSTGDGSVGWPEHAPYRAILVTAAAPRAPPALLEQLQDGGRLVIPVEHGGGFQELMIYTRHGDSFSHETAFAVRFVPLTGAAGLHAARG